jgi:hypothetical protein
VVTTAIIIQIRTIRTASPTAIQRATTQRAIQIATTQGNAAIDGTTNISS